MPLVPNRFEVKLMNMCPCPEEKPLIGVPGQYARPRLFNWITILLVTAWVVVVGIVAQTSQPVSPQTDGMSFLHLLP
ncbi:MAG TPA: hypothetical protein VJ998_11365 [Pseudomonadales bacterium]|nr:hypothetical protein [Pseudomonadales bacterium]